MRHLAGATRICGGESAGLGPGPAPAQIHAYEDLLARDDIDAVVVGTPDHQHCRQLIDATRAGKDTYVEKPLAMDLKELKRAYDTVKASDRVVQMGTQVRSFPSSGAAREFVLAGGLGDIFKIEQSRNSYKPYWYRYAERRLHESDTDWKRFLMHRKPRPWDQQQYAGVVRLIGTFRKARTAISACTSSISSIT